MRFAALARLLSLAAALVSCAHREPPTPDGSPSVALPELPAPAAPAAPASPQPSVAQSPQSPSTEAPASPPPSVPIPPPSAADASLLGQTHEMPATSDPRFDARLRGLWEAIVEDDPSRAMPFFFPVGAYEQVKDVPNPAADWKHRLVAAYAHDIHALHARLGGDATRAKLLALDVPESRARWVEPGEEYNKLGYYRVFGSRLRYDVDGTGVVRVFDVKSLISWRGEWYVVHLSAIK